jgi:PAS domain S-box-containing protein
MPSQTNSFEGLLEAVPDALVGMDTAGVIRFVNHQTELLFGYDRDALVGAPIETLVPESVRQAHVSHRQAYDVKPRTRLLGTTPNLTGRRRDGTQFPVDIALSPWETQDGVLVIAAVRDMTAYHAAEADRRRVDQQAAIVEHSNDAIIASTLDGILTSWNPAAKTLYGYAAEEVTGKSIDLLSPHGHAGEIQSILARIRAGQPVERLDATHVRKDGSAITVSLTVSPIRDADGHVVGVSTIARDMTGARQAFEAARSMIESSLDSLVAISPEGKITDANQATVKLTGVPRDQLIGTSFCDYFTDPAKAEAIYQRVFTEGMAVDYPLTLPHWDGHETFTEVLYNASVYRDGAGKVLGVFAAARDVTEQMRAQREVVERLAELEQFQRLTVGRELKMIELKKEIDYLRKLGPTGHGESDGQA